MKIYLKINGKLTHRISVNSHMHIPYLSQITNFDGRHNTISQIDPPDANNTA